MTDPSARATIPAEGDSVAAPPRAATLTVLRPRETSPDSPAARDGAFEKPAIDSPHEGPPPFTVSWDAVARFAAAAAGALLLHYGWEYWTYGRVYVHHEIAVMDLFVYASAFALFWLALVRAPRARQGMGLLILATTLLITVIGTYVWTQAAFRTYNTDVMAFEHYAARLVLHGTDPYTRSMRPALGDFQVPLASQTLAWNGQLVDRVSYPAGSFLMFVPFVALGIPDLRWVVLLVHLAAISVLYAASPRRFRPLILLPVLASPELVQFTGAGVVDFPWVLALLLMIARWPRPALAGLCYGAACALKQEPWFLAPFLIVYFLRNGERLTMRERLENLGAFALPAAGLFLAVNGPFIARNPLAWLLGTLEPALGRLLPLGQGPSTLVQLGAAVPADAFTLVAMAFAALLVINYAVYFDRLRDTMWVFPMMITWLMPRSLHNYFVFWIPVIALVLARRLESVAGDSARAS